jgi:hypothetical protein
MSKRTRALRPAKCMKAIILMFAAVSAFPCGANAKVKVRVSEAATAVFVESGEHVPIEAYKEHVLNLSEPVQIVSSTRIPVLLVPVYHKNVELVIDSPPVKSLINQVNQTEVNVLLSSLMANVADIQNLIQKRRLNEAMERLQILRAKHPDVKYLDFIRASILLLKGNREEALKTATEALRFMPDYEEGKRFVRSLQRRDQ